MAEYQRQVQLTQQQATQYRDQLNDKVLRGEVTVEDASTQFDRWWDGNVEAKLTPYQTMAEGAYRKEQNEYLQAQAQEQARVEALNRQRETLGYQAGEKARDDLNALAPQARCPEFLAQLAQNVSRIGQPLPGGPSQHSGGMQFSPESLSLENVRKGMPNLTEVGNQAVARALSQHLPRRRPAGGGGPAQAPRAPRLPGVRRAGPVPDSRPHAGAAGDGGGGPRSRCSRDGEDDVPGRKNGRLENTGLSGDGAGAMQEGVVYRSVAGAACPWRYGRTGKVPLPGGSRPHPGPSAARQTAPAPLGNVPRPVASWVQYPGALTARALRGGVPRHNRRHSVLKAR